MPPDTGERRPGQGGAPDAQANGTPVTVTRAGAKTADHATLLALSDERDTQLAARLAAWREGYATGAAEQYAEGYAAAITDVKRAQHATVDALKRGRPGPGRPRPSPGGGAWLAAVVRHGCTEYGGAAQPRVPVVAVDVARVWLEQQGAKR